MKKNMMTMTTLVKKLGKLIFAILLVITATQAYAADRYWVGGTGNWSNTANWAATSGGAGGVSVPVAGDDVFFNAASGAGTVTIDVAAVCRDFNWSSSSIVIVGTGGNTLTVNRNYTAGNNTNLTMAANLTVTGTFITGTGTVIALNGTANIFNGNVTIGGTTGAAVSMNNATFRGANNQFLQRFIFTGTTTFDVNSSTTFAGGAFNKNFQNVTVKQGATLDMQTTFPGVDQFTNLTVESNTTVLFNGQALGGPPSTNASTIITGRVIMNVTTCTTTPSPLKYANLGSTNGNLCNINFGSDQDWNNIYFNTLYNVGVNFGNIVNVKSGSIGFASPSTFGFEDWGASVGKGRRVYWIGGTLGAGVPQDWSDCRNWATSSGGSVAGSAGIDPPQSGLDTVIFDASSFTATKNTVNVDVVAGAYIMDWSGATNTPTLTGTSAMTITNSLNFIGAMNVTHAGQVFFSSDLPNNTITMAGKSFNNTVTILSGVGTGVWNILDNLNTNSISAIRVLSGTLNTNNNPITAGAFTANSTSSRTLNLGASAITINGNVAGTGIQFDMTSPNHPSGLLTLNSGTSTVTFNNGATGDVIIETGKQSKTLPNFVFTGFTNQVLTINSNSDVDAGRITFQNLNIATSGSPIVTLQVTGKAAKTYGAINFQSNIIANFDGIANSTPGSNNIVGTFTSNNNIQANFNNSYTFNGAFTNLGTGGTGITFTGDVAGTNNIFNGTVSVLGINAKVGFVQDGNNDFNQDVTIGSRIVWSFNSCATCLSTVAAGRRVLVVANCGDDVILNSSGVPTAGAARVNFVSGNTYNWQNTVAQNLNNSLGTTVAIILGGGASTGNTNITVVPTAPRVLYWVGGSGNWNDQNKWSLVSGSTAMPNSPQCPPRIIDDVVFDNNSLTGTGGYTVNIDADAEAKNVSFNGTTDIPTLAGNAGRTITIAGNVVMAAAGSVVQNASNPAHYQGRVIFTDENPPGAANNIALRGTVVFNNVAFGSPVSPTGSAWTLDATNGDLTVLNKLEVVSGTLNTNGRAISAAQLDANPKGLPSATSNLARTLNMTNSQITITGVGTTIDPAIDLRGSAFTLLGTAGCAGTARFIIPNAGNVELNTGDNTITMPRIDFTATTNGGTININTANNNNRVTFCQLNIDANRDNVTFNVNGTAPKTYSAGFNVGSGAGNDNITVNLTGNTTLQNIFTGATVLGRVGSAPGFTGTITGNNQFNGTVSVGTTTTAGVVFSGTGNNVVTGAYSVAAGSRVTYSNTGTTSFANIGLNANVVWTFTNGGTNTLNGVLTSGSANCSNLVVVTAAIATANINATAAQSWTDVLVSNLNSTGATITILSKDLLASTGNFVAPTTTRAVYWVGGRADNTLSSDNLWNNPNNWSDVDPTSGAYVPASSPGACVPASCLDNVFFNAGSFVGGTGADLVVTINVNASCGAMNWTGATGNPRITGTGGTGRLLSICGDLTMITAMQSDGTAATYEGIVRFVTPTTPVVTNNIFVSGRRFNNIEFESANNTSGWLIRDTPTSNDNTLYAVGSVSLRRGMLTVNDVTGSNTSGVPATADINCNSFTANVAGIGDQIRQLVMGANSRMLIRGTGTVLDLQGNTANFTLTSDPTSTIELNNTGAITANTGTFAKTIPNLDFSAVSNGTITIDAPANTANRITFRNINVVSGTNCNNARKTVNIHTAAGYTIPKTYGIITFGDNITSTWNGTNNAIAGLGGTSNIFGGTVTMGLSTRANFNNNNYFDQAVAIGSTTTNGTNTQNVYFTNNNTFNSTLTFSAAGPGWATFGQNGTTNDFFGAVNFLGTGNNVTSLGDATSLVRFRNILNVASGCGTTTSCGATITANSTGDFSSLVEFRDNVTWGNCSGGIFTTPVLFRAFVDMFTNTPAGRLFSTGNDCRFTYVFVAPNTNPPTAAKTANFRDITHGENNLITYNGSIDVDNYNLTKFDIILFPRNNNAGGGTPAAATISVIRNRMTAAVNCNSWIRIASNLPTEQTNLQFNQPHTAAAFSGTAPFQRFSYVLFQDINKVAGGGQVDAEPANTSDISNNSDFGANGVGSGINFTLPITQRIFYWVKSRNQQTVNSTSGDWADENNDNHWSSPQLPVQAGTPGTLGLGMGVGGSGLGPSGCIPTPFDSVVFDNNSVKPLAGVADTVSIDKYSVYSRGQRWSNTKAMILTGQDVYTMHVYGTMTGNALTTNNFGGTYMFTGVDTQNGEIKDITMNTMRYFGPVLFNNEKDRWILQDNMNIENNPRGSLTISYGILDAGGQQNRATPVEIRLDGDFILNARVGSTGFDRNATFISRNSTVVFDGQNNDQQIAMSGSGTVVNGTSVGQMKGNAATNCVECTEYRITGAQPDVVKTAGVYPTNPASNLFNGATETQTISCNRSPFYNILVDKRWDRTLNVIGVNGAIALSIYNNLIINNGRLLDNGNQIRGNVTNPMNPSDNGGVMQMAKNTRLSIGANNVPTVFPTCYRTANITLAPTPNPNLVYADAALSPTPTNNATLSGANISTIDPTSNGGQGGNTSPEVFYIASGRRQMIAGSLTRTLAALGGTASFVVGPAEYGSLTLTNGSATNTKDLTASITVQGALRINGGTFRDMGNQITGNAFANTTSPQTYNLLYVAQGAALEIGTGSGVSATLTYSNNSLPTNIGVPLTNAIGSATANIATAFPTYTNRVADFVAGSATSGKMSINGASTVIYNAGADQAVLGNFSYGNLTVRSFGKTALPLINKTVTRHPSISSNIILTVNGNLLVDSWNNLIDDGWQIFGVATNPVTATTNTLTGNANSRLTIGIDDVGAPTRASTQFPAAPSFGYTRPNINLDITNETIYNAGTNTLSSNPNQTMSTTPVYGTLILRDPTLATSALIEKRFAPYSIAGVGIKGDLTIERHNHLNDDGNQLIRQTAGGTLRMENGRLSDMTLDSANITRLTLGNAAFATNLPQNFTTTQIEDFTTVVYNGTPIQNVAGGNMSPNLNGAAPNSYFNLWAQTTNATGTNGIKNLQGDIRVRGDFVIRQNVRFNDANDDTAPTNAFQITGNATGNMTMEANSELRLDKWARGAGTATIFPTNFVRNISPTESGISLAPSSTVIYNSNTAQEVSSRPMYGNITFRRFNGAVLVPKTVNIDRTDLDIRGNLRIEAFNSLIDNGRQIIGRTPAGAQPTAGTMFMANTALLTLGTQGMGAIGTTFPTGFLSANIDLDAWADIAKQTPRAKTAMNTIIYNSDVPQVIAGSGINGTTGPGRLSDPNTVYIFPAYYWNGTGNTSAYGNIRLSSSVAVTKTLAGTVNMRGNLFIDANNTLDADNTNNYRMYVGGDWFAAPGAVFTARQGRVTFDGYNVNQDIWSEGSSFYNIEINKTPNNNRTATLQQPLTATNRVFFKNGYFIADYQREFIYDVNANHGIEFAGTSYGTGNQYTTIDAAVDAATDGPSDNSHIAGPVIKRGLTTTRFFFPVGNQIFYAPLGITGNATDATKEVMGRYYGSPAGATPNVRTSITPPTPFASLPLTGPYPAGAINANCVNRISGVEFWTLDSPTSSPGIKVTLSWGAARSGGVTIPNALQVVHFLGSLWYCEGNDGTNTTNTAGGIMSSLNFVTTFSPFTLGSQVPNNPLPIQLVSFEAKPNAEKKIVDLIWQTANETNNEFFTLEKSKDGKTFIAFKEVPSKGSNSRTTLTYTDVDTEPMRGLSYYRLKQTDLDGKTSYSKIVPVYFEEDGENGILLYPNPTESNLNMQIFEKGNIEGYISVRDMLGREIHREYVNNLTSAKVHQVQLNQSIASGTYLLRFEGKNRTYVQKFTINK